MSDMLSVELNKFFGKALKYKRRRKIIDNMSIDPKPPIINLDNLLNANDGLLVIISVYQNK